jgi:DUF4097 and DUF4098 domain-containing protein YvlB
MNRRLSSVRTSITLAGMFIAVALAAPASAALRTESFQQTYDVAAAATVSVNNTNGHLEFRSWDRAEVGIEAVKKVRSWSDARAERMLRELEIRVEEHAGGLKVTTKYPSTSVFDWFGGGGSVDYVVSVPASVKVEAYTTTGGVEVAGVDAGVDCRTTNGRIRISDVGGPVRAHSTNGTVEAEVLDLREEISLGTTNGALRLRLPDGTGADLDASTTNGSIRLDADTNLVPEGRRKNRLRGDLAGGGPSVRLRTTTGSISITA